MKHSMAGREADGTNPAYTSDLHIVARCKMNEMLQTRGCHTHTIVSGCVSGLTSGSR